MFKKYEISICQETNVFFKYTLVFPVVHLFEWISSSGTLVRDMAVSINIRRRDKRPERYLSTMEPINEG